MATRTVAVRLMAETSQYLRGMREAGKTTRELSGEVEKANKRGKLDKITNAAAGLGVGLIGVAGAAVKFAADFDKQMSAVKAATHAGAEEIGQLRQAALDAGAASQYSATEAAQGIEELAKAGVATADILNGGLKGALDLAAAGGLGVSEAAETAASALTQFRLSGEDVPHVADLLAAAAGKAQGSVHDLGFALSQSGLVASQMGLSIEDATGTLAAFASAGLLGSDAGTSFKTMLLALANPSAKAAGIMEELGVAAYDVEGNFVGVTSLAGQLQTKLGGLTQAQRDSALATIFGSDAIRAANVLYQQGATGIQGWIDKTNDAGFAAETAAARTDNLAGDLERLKGSLETLAIEAGSGASGGLRTLTQMANGAVDAFAGLPASVQSTLTIVAGLSGAGFLGAAGLLKARHAAQDMLAELSAMGPTGARAATGLGKVASAAGKAAVAFAALQVAGAVVGRFQENLSPKTEAMAAGLEEFARTGKLSGEAARVLGGDLADLEVGFKFLADEDNSRRKAAKGIQQGLEGIIPGLEGANTSLAKTQERVTATDEALAQMVQGGHIPQAQASFAQLARVLAVNGVTVDEVKKQFPAFAAALEVASKESGTAVGMFNAIQGPLVGVGTGAAGATGPTKGLAGGLDTAAKSAKDARQALVDLAAEEEAAINPAFGVLAAQDKLSEAQKKYNDAVKEHGAKSTEAKAAARDLAMAAVDLQGKVGGLGESFDGKLTPSMRATFKAAGLTEAQIKAIERQMKAAKLAADQYDGDYAANTTAPGTEKAKKQFKDLQTQISKVERKLGIKTSVDPGSLREAQDRLNALLIMQEALKKGVPIHVIARQHKNERQAGARYDRGGWTGPGDTHDEAGIVHADEYVIKKASRRRIEQRHPGLLDEMNATGQMPGGMLGYAGGGWVRFPLTAAMTRIPSKAEAASAVTPSFGSWPSSPGAQRGDSGVWRRILTMVKASGIPYQFGNSYRPGDPKWHGSGRAIDFMGYGQDRLAKFFLARQSQVLEMIHRTSARDYAYTRGVNKGSFNQALMQAHRNHLHIAMANGGVIGEPVFGVGASGRSYSFGERGNETVTPGLPQAEPAAMVFAAGASGGDGVSAKVLGSAVRAALTGVTVILDGRAVGQVQARQADLYARGG